MHADKYLKDEKLLVPYDRKWRIFWILLQVGIIDGDKARDIKQAICHEFFIAKQDEEMRSLSKVDSE